jgi:hypothetical protein
MDTERFNIEKLDPPFRWHVFDDKYDESFLVDLRCEEFGGKPKCGCKEFRFHVELKKPSERDRDTCVHIDFAVLYLTTLAKLRKPKPLIQ